MQCVHVHTHLRIISVGSAAPSVSAWLGMLGRSPRPNLQILCTVFLFPFPIYFFQLKPMMDTTMRKRTTMHTITTPSPTPSMSVLSI